MKRILLLTAIILLALRTSEAQTIVTPNPANVINANAQRGGVNQGTPTSYDEGLMFKNLFLPGNAGGEGAVFQQIWQIQVGANPLTTTSFNTNLNNDWFNGVPTNYWQGATLTVPQSCGSNTLGCTGGGAELGCSSTITSNTTKQTATATSFSLTGNVMTVIAPNNFVAGQNVIFFNWVTATFINGSAQTITSATSSQYTFAFTHATVPSTADVGTATAGPAYTFSPACAAPIAPGDVVQLSTTILPTEAQLLTNGFGMGVAESGAAHVTLETTDLCALCGASSFKMDTSAGGTVTLSELRDNMQVGGTFVNQFRNLGISTMDFMFWAKCVSGTCSITPSAGGNGMTCNPGAIPLTGGAVWTKYVKSCAVTMSTATTGGFVLSLTTTAGGVSYLDNIDFEQDPSTTDPTNTTVFSDGYVNALRQMLATGQPGNPGTYRYNPSTVLPFDDWIQPTYAQIMSNEGDAASAYSSYNYRTSLVDYLALCTLLQSDPYIIVPITLTVTEAQHMSDFLYGGSGTVYGAKRIALGGPSATGGYANNFRIIHLTLGNENWNSGFLAFSLNFRAGTTQLYQDYTSRGLTIATAFRNTPSYLDANTTKGGASFVLGVQTAQNGSYITSVSQFGAPDEIEFEQYTGGNLNNFSTPTAEFQPMFTEPYGNFTSSSSAHGVFGSYTTIQAQHNCGGNKATTCKASVYEEGNGVEGGTATQAVMDGYAPGGAIGVGFFDQVLTTLKLGKVNTQNLYAATGYFQQTGAGVYVKLWSCAVDYNGASTVTNASFYGNGGNWSPRPCGLGLQLANYAIIGPMIDCPITGTTGAVPYNLTVASNGVNPVSNVPTIRAYCFQDSTNANHFRMALTNASLTTSYPITWGGAFAPTIANVQQMAPTNPTDSNEAGGNNKTNTTAATVRLNLSPNQNVSSGITLPPFSGTVLDFTIGVLPTTTNHTLTGRSVHSGAGSIK